MEDLVYKAAKAYINTNVASITSKSLDAPLTQAWWEDQMNDALSSKENDAQPFDFPALLYQFTPTKYHTENNGRIKATGEMIVHLAQWRVGIDGKSGAETETSFNTRLQYLNTLVGIFHGVKLSCAATLILINTERDHTNNPIMHEKITFSWTATKKTSAL